jgi:antitoxin YefM
MSTETSHTHARANLAALCDQVISTREQIVIRRRGCEDVALVAAAELRGLMETVHLMRSPKNTLRILTALVRAQSQELPTEAVDTLRRVRSWPSDVRKSSRFSTRSSVRGRNHRIGRVDSKPSQPSVHNCRMRHRETCGRVTGVVRRPAPNSFEF